MMRWISQMIFRGLAILQGIMWDRGVSPKENQCCLDIGCGTRKRVDFLGVDKVYVQGVDVVCNLEISQLPFNTDTFDIINASHILEHINNLNGLLSEVSRVLKPGGKFQITLPYAGDLRAFQDPTHVRFFTLKTFEYYVREGSSVGAWYQTKYFARINRRHLIFGMGPFSLIVGGLINRSQWLLNLYERTLVRFVPARDLQVELIK